jgi:hypothetical protein
MHTERRQSPRYNVLRRARIVLPGGHCTLACVLLDMSKNGARITTDEWLTMPDAFVLRLDDGNKRMADVRYRHQKVAGIRFTDVMTRTETAERPDAG